MAMTGVKLGRYLCAAAFAATLVAGFVDPARAQTVNVSVDATAAGMPLQRVWPYHGYDEANYSTTTEGKALLASLARAHTAPVHVRTHFLLNTGNGTASLKWGSTNVYAEDAAGNPVYSWTLMDGIMDAITGAGTFPFVEVAFMPQALSTTPTPYMNSGIYTLDGGSLYPPRDYTKWGNLITAWAQHMNGRYPNVAASWMWELWNEPDISYWHGTPAEYQRLYDVTEASIHGVLPTAPVGGPAVANATSPFLPQFLQHCATGINAVTGRAGTRLDLITFHAKGGAQIVGGRVEMDLGNQLRLHRSGFNAVASIPMYRQTPIHITEADPDGCAACPVSTTPADAYRNSPAYGAYEVAMMKRTLELGATVGVNVAGLLTWAFTFPGTPYFAGYRALTTNGINLPVMGAFKLLGSLNGTRMPVTSSGAATLTAILANSVRGTTGDVDAMATLNGQSVQVLLWNYHDDLVAAAPAPVQLSVRIPVSFGPRVAVTHTRVDETHGDAYTVWTSQGSPAAPSDVQLTALRQAMDPVALAPAQQLDVTGGAVSVSFDLPRFGVSLLTFTASATTGDAGVAPVDAAPAVDAPARDLAVDVALEGATGGDVNTGGDAPLDGTAPSDARSIDNANNPNSGTSDVGPVDASASDAARPATGGGAPESPPAKAGGCGCSFGAAGRSSRDVRASDRGLGDLAIGLLALMLARRRRPRRSRRQTRSEPWGEA